MDTIRGYRTHIINGRVEIPPQITQKATPPYVLYSGVIFGFDCPCIICISEIALENFFDALRESRSSLNILSLQRYLCGEADVSSPVGIEDGSILLPRGLRKSCSIPRKGYVDIVHPARKSEYTFQIKKT